MATSKILAALSLFGLSIALALTGVVSISPLNLSSLAADGPPGKAPPKPSINLTVKGVPEELRVSEHIGTITVNMSLVRSFEEVTVAWRECGLRRIGGDAVQGEDYVLADNSIRFNNPKPTHGGWEGPSGWEHDTTITILDKDDGDGEVTLTVEGFCDFTGDRARGYWGEGLDSNSVTITIASVSEVRIELTSDGDSVSEDGDALPVTMSIEPPLPYAGPTSWSECGLRAIGGTALIDDDYTLGENDIEFSMSARKVDLTHTTTITPVNRTTPGPDKTIVVEGFCEAMDDNAREAFGATLVSNSLTITLIDDEGIVSGPPTNLQASVNNLDNIALNWNVPTENADVIAAYELYRRVSGVGDDFQLLRRTTQPHWTDTSSISGVVYDYVVRTVNDLGTAGPSSNVVAIGRDISPPDDAVDLTAMLTTTRTAYIVTSQVSWRMPEARDGALMPNHFKIYRNRKGASPVFNHTTLVSAGSLSEFSAEGSTPMPGVSHKHLDVGTGTYSFIETWNVNDNNAGLSARQKYRYTVATAIVHGDFIVANAPMDAPTVPINTPPVHGWPSP